MPGMRDESGKFVKGVSGNPSGRAKVPDNVRDMLKAASPEAAQKLIDTMRTCKDPKVAVDCAKTILDRVYGKATQAIDLGNKDEQPFKVDMNVGKLSDKELSDLELLVTKLIDAQDTTTGDN